MKLLFFVFALILSTNLNAQDPTEVISFDRWDISLILSDEIEITPPNWPRQIEVTVNYREDSLEAISIDKHPYNPPKVTLEEQFKEDLRTFQLISDVDEKWSLSLKNDSIELYVIGYQYEAKVANIYDEKPKGGATYGIMKVNDLFYMIESRSINRKSLVEMIFNSVVVNKK